MSEILADGWYKITSPNVPEEIKRVKDGKVLVDRGQIPADICLSWGWVFTPVFVVEKMQENTQVSDLKITIYELEEKIKNLMGEWDPLPEVGFTNIELEYDQPTALSYAAEWIYLSRQGRNQIHGKLPQDIRLFRRVKEKTTKDLEEKEKWVAVPDDEYIFPDGKNVKITGDTVTISDDENSFEIYFGKWIRFFKKVHRK